jgi:D-lactate dehydrogenase
VKIFSRGNFALVDAEKAAPSRRTPKRFARNAEVPFLVCEPYPCYQRNPWLNLWVRLRRSGTSQFYESTVKRGSRYRSQSMKVAIFSAKNYDREFLSAANAARHEIHFFEPHLNEETVGLAAGFGAVCVFVNDRVNAAVIARLASLGIRLVALRCAGYNNVDLPAAKKHGITVVRVPGYSPYAVAEHTVGLMLALNRKLHRAYNRVREGNLALDGLLGFDMHGKTAGIIGTGKIGAVVAQILTGFGCPTLAFDPVPNDACRSLGVRYVKLDDLLAQSDIITLHCPLTPQKKHMIHAAAIER